jgi:hypothetical protein
MISGDNTPKPSPKRLGGKDDDEKCNVFGCKETAIRSISVKKVKEVFSGISVPGKRARLCKTHYKEFKKKNKPDREAERLGWG